MFKSSLYILAHSPSIHTDISNENSHKEVGLKKKSDTRYQLTIDQHQISIRVSAFTRLIKNFATMLVVK